MDDEKVHLSQKVEAWISKLPAIGTYRERETRRETDKRVRERLSATLYKSLSHLRELTREVSSSEDLSFVAQVDRICSMVQQLADTIRFASYGYGGIFDLVKIQDEELGKLCEFDLYLVEDVDSLEQKAQSLLGKKSVREDLRKALKELEEHCKKIQGLFARRRDFITRNIP